MLVSIPPETILIIPLITGVTVIWVSLRFGHPHSQNP